ncbi:hypothetical protein BJV82DRAFT_652762 [Fennellomyces sp. T-0311]|nr:hypothetical protein BJV82DRAFT_652762 [Fennellomyces sp. T-0311]
MRFSLTILALALVSATTVLAQPDAHEGAQQKDGLGTLRSTVNPGVQKKVDAVLSGSGQRLVNTGGVAAHQKRHEPDRSHADDEDEPDDGDEDEGHEEHHGRDP